MPGRLYAFIQHMAIAVPAAYLLVRSPAGPFDATPECALAPATIPKLGSFWLSHGEPLASIHLAANRMARPGQTAESVDRRCLGM